MTTTKKGSKDSGEGKGKRRMRATQKGEEQEEKVRLEKREELQEEEL